MVFHLADAVFGGNRALAGQGVLVDDAVDAVFVFVGLVTSDMRQEGVEMQAAVAKVAEYDDFDALIGLLERGGGVGHQFGHAGDGHGDVVFDAGTERFLRDGDVFAQPPQFGAFALRLRQHGVFPATSKQKFGHIISQFRLEQAVVQFEQDMPLGINRRAEAAIGGGEGKRGAAYQLEAAQPLGETALDVGEQAHGFFNTV